MDVVETIEPWQQRMVLEHDAAFGARPGDFAPRAEKQAGSRLQQSGNEIEERGLAAARVADQRDEFAALHRQVDVAQRDERPLLRRERHLDALDVNEFGSDDRFRGVRPGRTRVIGHGGIPQA
jgi:hypothetical protein